MKISSATLLLGLTLSATGTCFGQAADGFAVVSGAAGAVTSSAQSAGQVVSGQGNVQPNVTGLTGNGEGAASAPPTGMVVNSVPDNYTQQQPAGTMAGNAQKTSNTAAASNSTTTTNSSPTGNTTQCQAWTNAVQQYAANYTSGGAPNPQALQQPIPSMSDLCPAQQSTGGEGGGGGGSGD